jgi:hypothetical protein
MPERRPQPLSAAQRRSRLNRLAQIATRLGFIGQVEYRHVYSQAGGAQYGRAREPQHDLLIVYAEAFDRDADPEDFSLDAILAHERGHQLLARHPRLALRVASLSAASEEILASILGAMVCPPGPDRDSLLAEATAELLSRGVAPDAATRQLQNLWNHLEQLL